MSKFHAALGFSGLFGGHKPRHNAQYQLVDAVHVVTGVVCGICQCVVLWSEEVLQRIAGRWLRIPNESTVELLFVGGYPGAEHLMRGVPVIGCHQGLTEG